MAFLDNTGLARLWSNIKSKFVSKTDFNTHTADATKHITAAERNTWNSGITPVDYTPKITQAAICTKVEERGSWKMGKLVCLSMQFSISGTATAYSTIFTVTDYKPTKLTEVVAMLSPNVSTGCAAYLGTDGVFRFRGAAPAGYYSISIVYHTA